MTFLRRTTGRIVPSLLVLGVGITLAGCSDSSESTDSAPETTSSASAEATSTSAAPAASYDIGRVDNIKDDFPAGFSVQTNAPKTLGQGDIDSSGVNSFTKATMDPPQCRDLVIPAYAEPSVGTNAAGIRAEGDQGNIFVVALGLPKPIPATPLPAGCDHVTLSGSGEANGTAVPIPAPQIEGVTTTGVKMSSGEDEDPDFIYTAALNDQTTVVVMGSTDPEVNPQQVLSDLLVKATAAIRGQ